LNKPDQRRKQTLRINKFYKSIKNKKMGIYNEGILGFFRGKVGRVVGSVVRGVHYMKGLGDFRADNPSQAQLDQRLKFALMTAFLRPLANLIKVGYPSGKSGITSANMALSANLRHAVTGISPNFTVDYAKFMFSKGALPIAAAISVASEADGKLKFAWDLKAGDAPTDQATLLVYNADQNVYVTLPNAAPRSAKTYTLQVPLDFLGANLYAWISFVSADKKSVSDSVYVGSVTLI
jgi:hypothetical protein